MRLSFTFLPLLFIGVSIATSSAQENVAVERDGKVETEDFGRGPPYPGWKRDEHLEEVKRERPEASQDWNAAYPAYKRGDEEKRDPPQASKDWRPAYPGWKRVEEEKRDPPQANADWNNAYPAYKRGEDVIEAERRHQASADWNNGGGAGGAPSWKKRSEGSQRS